MAVRTLHLVLGDSKCVHQDSYANLTDTRYDLDDAAVEIARIIGGVDDGSPVKMLMEVNQNGLEFPIGHGRKAAGETNPVILKHGFSSTQLRLNWRSYIANSLHQQTIEKVFEIKRYYEGLGDTVELKSVTMLLGVNDFEDGASTTEEEATRFIENTRRDLGPVPFFWCIPGTDIVKSGVTAQEITDGRAGLFAACAKFSRCYTYDETGVPLLDGVHQTADGIMAQGDGVLALMTTDGLAGDGFSALTRMAQEYTSLVSAQAGATAAQTEHGDRDENPANGGFGSRGSAARDPWPTTARSVPEKHPHHDTWIVPIDGVMESGPLAPFSDLRPVDLSWYESI